jgi:plastocyanin
VLLVSLLALAGASAILTPEVATGQSGASVTIKNFSFNPGTITVVIGVNNTVTWTNGDAVTHTVTSNNGSFGGSVPSGGTFTHTFTTPGVYSYHCSIHNFMKGTVKVLSQSSSSTSINTTNAVPEFPIAVIGIVLLTAILLASYAVLRKTSRPRVGLPG